MVKKENMQVMKPILTVSILLIIGLSAAGQGPDHKTRIAALIADKMRDSLALSDIQRDQVYALNLGLQVRKDSVWQAQPAAGELRRNGLQQVENTRDSLYKVVLTAPQLLLYYQKKPALITISTN